MAAWSRPTLAPAPLPAHRVDDFTPVEARLAWLEGSVREAMAEPRVRAVAQLALAHAGGPGAGLEARCAAALKYAQRAGYVADPPHQEWFQPVARTLLHGGDCDKLASLFVAIARLLGVRARLAWIDVPDAEYNHVTAEAWLGGRWVFCEPSICGARVGEHPLDAARRLDAWYIFAPGAGYVACPREEDTG